MADSKCFQIFNDGLNKLVFFFSRVCIVESKNHVALIHLGVVVVKESSLAMAYMEIARWFRREACDDLTFNGILQDASVGSVLLLEVKSGGEDSLFDELSSLVHEDF